MFLFILSTISLVSGIQFTMTIPIGLLLLLLVVSIASYRTWHYQYHQTLQLANKQKNEINYADLSNIQQAIMRGISTENDKRIVSMRTVDGAKYMGIGESDQQYDNDEIGAEIIELEKLNILRFDGYSAKSGNPIYKPTSLGLKIIKKLGGD